MMAKYIIPFHFGGSKNWAFLSQSDKFLSLLRKAEKNCIINILLLEQIKMKLAGEAQDVLLNSRCTRWSEIKDSLLQRFGDPRSEELLLHDLTTSYQNFN